MSSLFRAGTAALVLLVVCRATGVARAQVGLVAPADARQAAQFDAVTRAVQQQGFQDAAVVGVSEPGRLRRALYAVMARREQSSVLLVLLEPKGKEVPTALQIEDAPNPESLGPMGVRFEPFVVGPDLVDVVVHHRPFQLEMSSDFDRHHVVRPAENSLVPACTFEGNATWGYAKGYRSVQSTRRITVTKAPDGPDGSAFDIKTVEERIESTSRGTTGGEPPPAEHKETTVHCRRTPTGTYEPVKPDMPGKSTPKG